VENRSGAHHPDSKPYRDSGELLEPCIVYWIGSGLHVLAGLIVTGAGQYWRTPQREDEILPEKVPVRVVRVCEEIVSGSDSSGRSFARP
jgi:hypothetical protein